MFLIVEKLFSSMRKYILDDEKPSFQTYIFHVLYSSVVFGCSVAELNFISLFSNFNCSCFISDGCIQLIRRNKTVSFTNFSISNVQHNSRDGFETKYAVQCCMCIVLYVLVRILRASTYNTFTVTNAPSHKVKIVELSESPNG